MRNMHPSREELSARELGQKMIDLISGHEMSKQLIKLVDELASDHAKRARANGIDFPDLVVLPLIEQGHVQLVRRDLDEKAVQTIILNLTVHYPDVTARELAFGLKHAFPGMRFHSNLNLTSRLRSN